MINWRGTRADFGLYGKQILDPITTVREIKAQLVGRDVRLADTLWFWQSRQRARVRATGVRFVNTQFDADLLVEPP